MGGSGPAPVVVGVDDTVESLRAVRLAAREAARRRRRLHAVHAFIWPLLRVPVGPPAGAPPGAGLRNTAQRFLDQAVEEAHSVEPGLEVTTELIDGQPVPVLVGQAGNAALLVLGDRGLGPISGLLVGSVTLQICGYVDCPVLVARGRESATGPVVVGVDGSGLSERAIGFAVEEALLRGTDDVVAVHAFHRPVSAGAGDMLPVGYDADDPRHEEERVLAEALAGWRQRHPRLRISRRLLPGRPAKVLAEQSRHAGLLVVGAQGHNSISGLILGSVSQSLLRHSDCPVAVLRQPPRSTGR